MEKIEDKFEEIRPYIDTEVSSALARIADNENLRKISSYLFPGKDGDYFKNILLSCNTVDSFQQNVMTTIVNKILSDTAKSLTYGGLENIDRVKRHILLSNHRDITLDSAIMQIIFNNHNMPTTEIAVGDNLITSQFIEDLARSNKMIKVIRSSSPREVYTTSQVLSGYIRHQVANNISSVWIAQRNGRTKDGFDVTEQGVLKMFDMSGSGNFVDDFDSLSILPVSISYEYEPCDLLKTIEIYISRRKKYVKAKNEDLNSILTGVMQFKGNIHIEFNKPVSREEIEELAKLDKNEKFKALAHLIDTRIVPSYKLWKNNYIAYDILTRGKRYESEYTQADMNSFISYMRFKLSEVDGDKEELEDIFLHIYANPIINKMGLGVL